MIRKADGDEFTNCRRRNCDHTGAGTAAGRTLSIDQIYVAYNAAMAREILKEKTVDLVICDIEMPQENGIHLLEWVREQEIKTEFVFLTSHEKFEYAYGAVQNGAANYLLKPIDMKKSTKHCSR